MVDRSTLSHKTPVKRLRLYLVSADPSSDFSVKPQVNLQCLNRPGRAPLIRSFETPHSPPYSVVVARGTGKKQTKSWKVLNKA